ncbi:shikimate O-hydroxycinnamoyltransferase-like [Olea europaea var. sylvestris]|uniref:shikimate O-hydroxycinnamoyltransferase-like n=1 Tax=Olea europaea var. sylvestris TaxID=158386 RepID=UPI000C1D37A7|nr:shikimate O-hydroxycinnamoyltransferase-like [Olea europaea var. sylvestris]
MIHVKRDFEVKLSKNEVVAPVLPVQENRMPLSNLDLLLPPMDVGVFFCYKKPENFTFESMMVVLKKALAQTLVSYYAFVGELVKNEAGEPEILYNNRGVDFVEALADVEIKDLDLYNPDATVEGKLVPKRKKGLLAIQATQLKCGGMVVACTFSHRMADAYSANMFLVSWAEMALSKPLTQIPSFCRSILFPRRPTIYDVSVDNMYVPISTLPPPPEANDQGSDADDDQIAISRIYYIQSDRINDLQLLANADNGSSSSKRKRTKLEAFSAFLWKMIAAGEFNRNDKFCRLGIVVDGRTRLINGDENQAKLIEPYFGNVLSIPFGEKKIEELKERPLSWIANEIHEFLESAVTKEHFLGLIDWVEAHRPEPCLAKIYCSGASEEEPAVVVSSGQHFPVKKMNFGWGEPCFGSYHFPWGGKSGYVMPMPSPKGNGDWIVYMHLLKGQLELIETNAANVFSPLTCQYLCLD